MIQKLIPEPEEPPSSSRRHHRHHHQDSDDDSDSEPKPKDKNQSSGKERRHSTRESSRARRSNEKYDKYDKYDNSRKKHHLLQKLTIPINQKDFEIKLNKYSFPSERKLKEQKVIQEMNLLKPKILYATSQNPVQSRLIRFTGENLSLTNLWYTQYVITYVLSFYHVTYNNAYFIPNVNKLVSAILTDVCNIPVLHNNKEDLLPEKWEPIEFNYWEKFGPFFTASGPKNTWKTIIGGNYLGHLPLPGVDRVEIPRELFLEKFDVPTTSENEAQSTAFDFTELDCSRGASSRLVLPRPMKLTEIRFQICCQKPDLAPKAVLIMTGMSVETLEIAASFDLPLFQSDKENEYETRWVSYKLKTDTSKIIEIKIFGHSMKLLLGRIAFCGKIIIAKEITIRHFPKFDRNDQVFEAALQEYSKSPQKIVDALKLEICRVKNSVDLQTAHNRERNIGLNPWICDCSSRIDALEISKTDSPHEDENFVCHLCGCSIEKGQNYSVFSVSKDFPGLLINMKEKFIGKRIQLRVCEKCCSIAKESHHLIFTLTLKSKTATYPSFLPLNFQKVCPFNFSKTPIKSEEPEQVSERKSEKPDRKSEKSERKSEKPERKSEKSDRKSEKSDRKTDRKEKSKKERDEYDDSDRDNDEEIDSEDVKPIQRTRREAETKHQTKIKTTETEGRISHDKKVKVVRRRRHISDSDSEDEDLKKKLHHHHHHRRRPEPIREVSRKKKYVPESNDSEYSDKVDQKKSRDDGKSGEVFHKRRHISYSDDSEYSDRNARKQGQNKMKQVQSFRSISHKSNRVSYSEDSESSDKITRKKSHGNLKNVQSPKEVSRKRKHVSYSEDSEKASEKRSSRTSEKRSEKVSEKRSSHSHHITKTKESPQPTKQQQQKKKKDIIRYEIEDELVGYGPSVYALTNQKADIFSVNGEDQIFQNESVKVYFTRNQVLLKKITIEHIGRLLFNFPNFFKYTVASSQAGDNLFVTSIQFPSNPQTDSFEIDLSAQIRIIAFWGMNSVSNWAQFTPSKQPQLLSEQFSACCNEWNDNKLVLPLQKPGICSSVAIEPIEQNLYKKLLHLEVCFMRNGKELSCMEIDIPNINGNGKLIYLNPDQRECDQIIAYNLGSNPNIPLNVLFQIN